MPFEFVERNEKRTLIKVNNKDEGKLVKPFSKKNTTLPLQFSERDEK